MALIECPNCGVKISNIAKKCPHCAFDFTKESTEKDKVKEFSQLPKKEQDALRAEYDSLNPDLSAIEKKFKNISKTLLFFFILTSLLFISIAIMLLIAPLDDTTIKALLIPTCILAFLFVVSVIVYRILIVTQRKSNKNRLMQLKKFQTWLKNRKQITYAIIFASDKEKAIFDSFKEEE